MALKQEETAVTNGIGNCLFCTPASLQIGISLVREMKDEQVSFKIKEPGLSFLYFGIRMYFWRSEVQAWLVASIQEVTNSNLIEDSRAFSSSLLRTSEYGKGHDLSSPGL
jgi:hypothetical protein